MLTMDERCAFLQKNKHFFEKKAIIIIIITIIIVIVHTHTYYLYG